MAKTHDPEKLYPGDVWVITGQCFNADGSAMSLPNGTTLSWKLVPKGKTGADAAVTIAETSSADGVIAITDPTLGKITITVNAAKSKTVPPGQYVDQLQASPGGANPSTQWEGPIEVRTGFFA